MKDEIKEILDKLNKIKIFGYNPDIINSFSYRDLNLLLDYITNLQEENEELKKNQRYHKKFGNDYIFCLEGDKETYKDYIFELQERIEKTIEYIDKTIELIKLQPTEDDTWILDRLNGFKYLLQGFGKDE